RQINCACQLNTVCFLTVEVFCSCVGKSFQVDQANTFNLVCRKPRVNRSSDGTHIKVTCVSDVNNVAVFRVEVRISTKEISFVRKRNERTEVIIIRSPYTPAVTQLEVVLLRQVERNVDTWKEVVVFSWIYFTGFGKCCFY